jgi:hypothetical protein
MGWDCFAFGPKGGKITDPKIKAAFNSAGSEVCKKAEYCDIHVGRGYVALDCSDTGQMINRAGVDAWNAGHKFRVQALKFNWDFEFTKEEAPYYWSARLFMEVCAKYDLTIQFSW